MTFQQAIAYFGNQNRTALALGVARASVNAWREKGIPLLRQYQIECLTGGYLIAGDEQLPAHTGASDVSKEAPHQSQ